MDHISKACQQIERNDATLTLLNLSCEFFGSTGVKKLANSCCSCNITSPENTNPHSPLVALWLETNEICTRGAEAIGQILEKSPSLKYLYMSHNPIYDSGITKLCPAAACQVLVLHVGDSKIGPAGARAISDILLDESSTVSTLILDNNHIRDQGAISIAQGLKENTRLKTLDLRYNRIGREGMIALRDVLKHENMTLQSLLLEEEEEEYNCDGCTRRRRRGLKSPRLAKSCCCEMCTIREEIDFYVALNRAGRHSFANNHISAGIWPRIMSNVSDADPSIIYTLLVSYRPELIPSEETERK